MASVYDQLSISSNKSSAMSSASRRTSSINSLLNPVSDEQASPSYQDNVDWYEPEDHPSSNQSWRRYSAPTLMSESLSTSNIDNNDGLTIINYCNEKSSQQLQVDSTVSQSMPTSPMSNNLSSEYDGTNTSSEKVPKRSTSSSPPSSRRSSMNRSSGSGQDVISSNGSSNMMTPPQTPGIKSPTKANFSFPPSSNGTADCNDQQNPQQIMPPKVKRKRITQEQLQDLVAMFEQTDTPSYDVREKLAKKLNMTNREVQVWFQNRRAKANRAKANEHNASHQHHRFLHHHSVTTAQAASGHASSINMMPHGNFTFVPMFTNGGPSPTGGPVRGRSNRRHSYVPPTNNNQKKVSQNTPLTRPRASTVTGAPMTSMSSHVSHVGHHSIHVGSHQQQTAQKMMAPAPIKIISSYDHHLHGISHHPGYYHSVPPSPVSPLTPMTPMTPLSPTTPTLPPINYMLSGINNLTLPPPVPPIKSDYQQSSYQAMHNSHQQQSNMLPILQPGYSDTTTIKSEPSPIDLLATAAELVQSEEKEKERLKALTINNNAEEETYNDKKWRPWLV